MSKVVKGSEWLGWVERSERREEIRKQFAVNVALPTQCSFCPRCPRQSRQQPLHQNPVKFITSSLPQRAGSYTPQRRNSDTFSTGPVSSLTSNARHALCWKFLARRHNFDHGAVARGVHSSAIPGGGRRCPRGPSGA